MKKLAILATMFAAVTLASCGNKAEEGTENTDSTATEAPVEVEETPAPVDTVAVDTAVTADAAPAEAAH